MRSRHFLIGASSKSNPLSAIKEEISAAIPHLGFASSTMTSRFVFLLKSEWPPHRAATSFLDQLLPLQYLEQTIALPLRVLYTLVCPRQRWLHQILSLHICLTKRQCVIPLRHISCDIVKRLVFKR